jgi:Raf kinase inhibitor-like YbhB/YbcL family protein
LKASKTLTPHTEVAVKLTSSALSDGSPIPKKHTGDGGDVSPPLAWEGAPAATKEFALVVDDPDAPTPQPWVHWVLYRIPAGTSSLPEGASRSSGLPGVEGKNSWKTGNTLGYRGPAPPPGHGVHHYHFRLYALDTTLTLPPRMDKEAVLGAIKGHILAEAELVGTYERK